MYSMAVCTLLAEFGELWSTGQRYMEVFDWVCVNEGTSALLSHSEMFLSLISDRMIIFPASGVRLMTVELREVTCTAPVNIAVIKYWGKRDTKLILPTNSSLSITLSQSNLATKTTLRADKLFAADTLWLNGENIVIAQGSRFDNILKQARALRLELVEDGLATDHPDKLLSQCKLHICSENNFPTAAGLASSASGFACLTYALAQLYALPLPTTSISKLARIGSGSACRSLFGGFVAWEMGELANGEDSHAIQIAPSSHWPEMNALILVVSDTKKTTSSAIGMQNTVLTSDLLNERIRSCVPKRMKDITDSILERNFDVFADITMKDSNQFHAVCLDTFPPIFYLTDVSKAIIHFVHAYNDLTATADSKYKCAYTFDAGPNAVLYTLVENVPKLLSILSVFFPDLNIQTTIPVDEHLVAALKCKGVKVFDHGCVNRIIQTRVGDGPKVLSNSGWNENVSLLNRNGGPK